MSLLYFELTDFVIYIFEKALVEYCVESRIGQSSSQQELAYRNMTAYQKYCLQQHCALLTSLFLDAIQAKFTAPYRTTLLNCAWVA